MLPTTNAQLDAATEALRIAIRNEQTVADHKTAWDKMYLTCAQKKKYEKKWTSDIYGRR